MTTSFSLSINSVIRSVCAGSALKSFMATQSVEMPPLLTPDNRMALAEFVRTVTHIEIPGVLGRSCSVKWNGDDILDVSFSSKIAPSLSLVNTIESMLASRVIARLFSVIDPKFAQDSDKDASRPAEIVRSNLLPDGDTVPISDDDANIPLSVNSTLF